MHARIPSEDDFGQFTRLIGRGSGTIDPHQTTLHPKESTKSLLRRRSISPTTPATGSGTPDSGSTSLSAIALRSQVKAPLWLSCELTGISIRRQSHANESPLDSPLSITCHAMFYTHVPFGDKTLCYL